MIRGFLVMFVLTLLDWYSFYHGCSTFLPIFDAAVDTYDALHERSPFAVDCICMVAAQVRDGGGKRRELLLYQKFRSLTLK